LLQASIHNKIEFLATIHQRFLTFFSDITVWPLQPIYSPLENEPWPWCERDHAMLCGHAFPHSSCSD